MHTLDANRIQEALTGLVGARKVVTDSGQLEAVAGDKWFARGEAQAAVMAESVDDVRKTLVFAHETSTPVTTRGAGFGYVGGCVPVRGGIVLDMSRMNRIREIHERDFVAVVEPGVLTGQLQEEARSRGLFYPPDPASLKECSIGGNIATNAGGPRCLKYGVTRNYVLGLEVVLADGRIVRVGGRTHKNKTGFDLVGLFTGSEGMLGVVTEATLRLLPHPPARAALAAGFKTIHAAAEAVQKIFASGFLPSAVEVADRFTLQAARDRLGSHRILPGEAHVLLEIDGQAEGVRSERHALEKLLQSADATAIDVAADDQECEQLWALRREFSMSLKATGLTKLNEDVVVPRGRLVDLVEFAAKLQEHGGFPIACFGHAGDGNIHVNIMVGDYDDKAVQERAEEVLDALFAQVAAWGGVLTGEHGIGLAKKRWWKSVVSEEVRELHRTVKNALDPLGILNPGKFL